VRSIIGTRCVTNRVGLVSTRSCLIVIGRLEAVDVATSRHADADGQSRRRRSLLRFMFHFRAYN
jgi:hypothetical protein